MFEAKLKSRSQPKLGALAVTFPIPEERYENVILALQNLQIGDVRKQDCCIESIRAPDCPALLRMTNTMANVDELDWLGKQLESFDRYELLQFNAAVERFGLSAADELIDLSFCARDVTVVSDFNDLELVGKRHYGYELFHGQLRILPSEAQFVKWIFQAYLSGLNAQSIAEQMNQAYALLGAENTRKWYNTTILYILSNERYIGDSLWQKTYATDSLPTRQIKNTGEKIQYYAEHTHTAIIDKETYSAVQRLREKRKLDVKYNDDYQPNILKKRILCANCKVPFQRKLRSGETKWMCRVHNNSKDDCPTFPIEEVAIHSAFCRLYYKLKHHRNSIFTQMLSNLQKIRYSRMLWSEDVISLNKKISDTLSQVQFLTQLQQAGGVDPDTFISSNNKLSEQLRRLKQEKARLLDTDSDDLADRTRDLMDALEDGPDFLDGFDAELFDALVEKIIVDSNECLRFRLKNGLELTEQIERTRR